MPQAIALYPFQGSTEHDLSVQKNEILDVVSDNEEVFWMVRNRYGQTGMVPVTHLAAPIFDKSITIVSRGRAITAHESKDKNILSVDKGQKVTIFDKSDNYWLFVGFQGQTGYLPKDIIKELKAPPEKHESDLQKFVIQDITPSKALCEEETTVLLLFQKPLPTKGQYFIKFKGKCNKTKVLAERLDDFILKISTRKYYPAEKTSVIICHKQSESHKQLISLGVEFEFESITDVVERILHAKSVPVDVPRRLYEILGKYMEAHEITETRKETDITEDNYTKFEKTIDTEDDVYEEIDDKTSTLNTSAPATTSINSEPSDQPTCDSAVVVCNRPFEEKELYLIAERICSEWEKVATLTNLFKKWEIDDIALNITRQSPSKKSNEMLSKYKSRKGTRITLAMAIKEAGFEDIAQNVQSGFYID
ncbi:uncharacterized protein LOC124438379 isoform X4 [Xenia sp. Carnegie-2017]|uniref:uncharacterized protein LOC124438379 isoform X4 n=1 Tax=Xenia sp. Carnegie-2017 TaxID=2897299 RepID=UPI001F03FFB5|nr:uncharacterized protein LOC124438379 isoform X4 [Xenia sp. Carnegie-2017]